ncbi:MAG: hypothetical protein KJ556_21135 [Gammaproteobacteria bacterium]|nr:hypothetical protein [Gammaproteobacteria bacterium]
MTVYPKNKKEWWDNVDSRWHDLDNIIMRFIPNAAVEAATFKQNHDERLADIFQTAWSKAPDASWIHSIPGWGVLCDLCSERFVLEE